MRQPDGGPAGPAEELGSEPAWANHQIQNLPAIVPAIMPPMLRQFQGGMCPAALIPTTGQQINRGREPVRFCRVKSLRAPAEPTQAGVGTEQVVIMGGHD